jgi:hypothetical protein
MMLSTGAYKGFQLASTVLQTLRRTVHKATDRHGNSPKVFNSFHRTEACIYTPSFIYVQNYELALRVPLHIM